MRITGDEILLAALESVTAIGHFSDLRDEADKLSRRSRFVIDSANLSPDALGRQALEYVAYPTTPGYFLWGPGVDVGPDAARPTNVRAELPVEVSFWKVVQSPDYDFSTQHYGELTPLKDWINRHRGYSSDMPRMLYWARDVNDGADLDIPTDVQQGSHVFRYWPDGPPSYGFRLYATVPAITQVERGKTYELPQGVSNFLVRLLAVDAQEMLGFPPRAELYASLKSAAQGLSSTKRSAASRVTSPDWLDLDRSVDVHVRGGSWH